MAHDMVRLAGHNPPGPQRVLSVLGKHHRTVHRCFPANMHCAALLSTRLSSSPPARNATSRSEARQVLEAALQRPGGCGSRTAHTLYLKALINAEGGHYDQAVADAQAALGEAGQEPGPCWAATLALLALLLSAR